MKKVILNLSTLLSLTLLAACGSKNSELQAPAETFSAATIAAERQQAIEDPKVNILFVVDNSQSMNAYQEKLPRNMKLFADQFFKNSRLDYKIGVVPIYDSKYLNDQTVYRSGKRKMNALGELVPLKGLSSEEKPGQVFITRNTKDAENVFLQTVLIGTQWGPEAEESFSPVIGVADEKINAEKNQGFYDPKAYLAIIFVTDSDDVTPGLSGEEFYKNLLDLKHGDRSKILIAAALPSLNNHSVACEKDGHGAVQSFPALMAVSGAVYADICTDDFGTHLAQFAQDLIQRVSTQKIAVGFAPDINSLQVSYGAENSKENERTVIARGENGYLFNADTNEVILSPDLNFQGQEKPIIFVKAVHADLGNYQNGRLKVIK